jgi:hypothetical protein
MSVARFCRFYCYLLSYGFSEDNLVLVSPVVVDWQSCLRSPRLQTLTARKYWARATKESILQRRHPSVVGPLARLSNPTPEYFVHPEHERRSALLPII